MNALNPVLRVRDQLGDALDAHLDALARAEARAARRAARPRRHPARAAEELSARALRRHAPARDDRDGARGRPRGRDHGRADDRARRGRAAGDPGGDRRAPAPARFAVLFITHDLSLLLEIADRIAILYAGQIVEVGTAEEIHNRTAHPYTRGLLESFPSVHGPRRRLAGIPGSPPDLREPAGCPFEPRCRFATRRLRHASTWRSPGRRRRAGHISACPFVSAARRRRVARREPHERAVAGATRRRRARGRSCSRRTTSRRTSGSGAARTARPLGRPRGLAGATPRRRRARRRERLGQVDGRAAARRPGAPTGGQILLDGAVEPAARRGFRAYKSDVQMVFQDPFASLNPVHTVRYR